MRFDEHNSAWIFVGQGAQKEGMGADLFQNFRVFADAFTEASDATGLHLQKLALHGDAAQIALTEVTQPLMLTFGVALSRIVTTETELRPQSAAGHSLGEITALCVTEALALPEAASLVAARGRQMQTCVAGQDVAMAAILGLKSSQLEQICTQETRPDSIVVCANYNMPLQTVISGNADAVERAAEAALKAGARRAITLPVSAPFHSPLMAPMEDEFLLTAKAVDFLEPIATVWANVDALPYASSQEIPERLTAQLASPVRWTDQVRAMAEAGTTQFIEFAPSATLTSMVKRSVKGVVTLTISNTDDIRQLSN